MNETAYRKLTAIVSQPEAIEKTIEYLISQMEVFLKKRDKVLILFPDEPATIGRLMKEAVIRCDATPQFLEEDNRWLTMLKTAFVTRCDAIIGPPLMLLGLAKVAKHNGTPLFARNVLVAGYPCTRWMVDAIQHGLDCRVWGCYDPGMSAVVAGFACPHGHIHLWQERYQASVLDDDNRPVPEGSIGRIVLSAREHPDIQFDTGDLGRLDTTPCSCGWDSPRLMEVDPNHGVDPALSKLGESFHYWGSILDCRLYNSGRGLDLELIVFPGEKLPKFPSCAKLVVRAWNPAADEPFHHGYAMKKRLFSRENH